MANNENKAPKATENRVEVFIPKGYANDEPNLFVSVNGVNYLLPKGKKSDRKSTRLNSSHPSSSRMPSSA